MSHTPVMLKEAIENLDLKKGSIVIDATLGGGGYTESISDVIGDSGKVLAIDADLTAIQNFRLKVKGKSLEKRLKNKNIILENGNFKDLKKIVEKNRLKAVDACVFDLGISSTQLEDATRGFSFNLDAPLVMGLGELRTKNLELRNNTTPTEFIEESKTYQIVNKYRVEDLERVIREYGEERFAGRIAKAIIKNRPLHSTKKLAEVIAKAVPKNYEKGRIHPATRTFQALRIETNDELNSLKKALHSAVEILKPSGRIAVVSFHSLEDRIVKQFFKTENKDCVCLPEIPACQCNHKKTLKIITKKPIVPTEFEIENNHRSRSAKLRVAEKL